MLIDRKYIDKAKQKLGDKMWLDNEYELYSKEGESDE